MYAIKWYNLRSCLKFRFYKSSPYWITPCIAFVVCAALEGTFAQTAERQGRNSNAPQQEFALFERDLGHICEQLQIPGAVAGIVSNGQLVWSHVYDQAFQGRVADRPYASLESLFPIASVSKTMAAAIVMQLVNEGHLRLDDPITKYHPELQLPNTVTLERLLSHTSEDVPGEEFLYSGARYGLLTGAIERVTQKPYAQVLEERIFQPLEMHETLAGRDTDQGPIADALRARIAPPFEFDPQTRTAIPAEAPAPRVTTATGVITTLGDLAKYAEALDGDRLVSARDKQLMFTPAHSTRGETLPYGLGWFVEDYLGEHLVWHYGLVSGYSSLLVRVPERGLTLIVLADSGAMSDEPRLFDGDLARSPAALAFLADVVLPAHPVKPDPAISPEAAIAALRGLAPAIVPQQAKDARELARDALVAEARMEFYLGDSDNSLRLLQSCLKQYPELGLPRETEMLYLLVRLRRPELRFVTAEVGGALLEMHPSLAPVLYYDGLAEQEAGREDRAQMLWKRACNEWPRTQHWTVGEACLEAGQSYAGHDLRLARLYLDRAIVAGSGDTPDVARRLMAKLPVAH